MVRFSVACRNFALRQGFYLATCFRNYAIFLALTLSQIAWTHDVSLLGKIQSEIAVGDDALYPSLAIQTGHPYLYAIADYKTQARAFTAALSLNSGRLYPVAPISSDTPLDNRNMYFVEQVYLAGDWNNVAILLGRARTAAVAGFLTDVYVPELRLQISPANAWTMELTIAKAEADRFFDPKLKTFWSQLSAKWQNTWWQLVIGNQLLWDVSDQVSELFNPLWPVVVQFSRLCQENRLACISAFAENNGYLADSTTWLDSTWLELVTYAGPVEFQVAGVFQYGQSDVQTVALAGSARNFQPEHIAGAGKITATWVHKRFELSDSLIYQSGDDTPLDPRDDFRAYIGVLSYWDETAIFQGGINADFQTAILQTPGRMAHGLLASNSKLRLFLSRSELLLAITPLWAERAWNSAGSSDYAGERFYGLEVDGKYYWDLLPWLTLSLEADWLGGGRFPALAFGQGATGLESALADPGSIWLVALGVQTSWQRLW